jgi:hypothetical protein
LGERATSAAVLETAIVARGEKTTAAVFLTPVVLLGGGLSCLPSTQASQ